MLVGALIMASLVGFPAAAPAGQADQEPGQQPAGGELVASISDEDAGIINMILVKVNGHPILWSDLVEEEEARLPLVASQMPQQQLQAMMPEIRRQFLLALIDEQVVLQRAELLEIEISANDIDRTVVRWREGSGLVDDEQFEQALAAEGLSIAELRERIRQQLLSQQLIYSQVNSQIFVGEGDIEEYYDANISVFSEPEQVTIRQIVFLLEGKEPSAIRAEAEAALAELVAGASIEAVGAKYRNAQVEGGIEPSPVAVTELLPAIAEGLEGVQEGGFAALIETRYGVHIVSLLQRQQQTVQPLEAVSDEIRDRVMQEKYEDRFEKYLQELRERTHIEIFAQQYQQIAEEWNRAGVSPGPVRRR